MRWRRAHTRKIRNISSGSVTASGEFEISAGSGHRRGTKVVVSLKEDARQYSDQDTLQDILRKYSAFVPFPLRLNGEQINTADALWLRNKNEITDQEYGEFYRFQTNSF